MKLAHALLLLATATSLSAADLSGSWKLYYTWPNGPGAKTLGDIVLDLKVDGDKVTGVAHLASWPGDAPIAKIDNGRITFTATGRLTSSTGIPTCRFEVTVNGKEMTAEMTAITNSFIGDERLIFKGRRIDQLASIPRSPQFKSGPSIALEELRVTRPKYRAWAASVRRAGT